jgi:twitching motility two-component system response regulator PilH
MVGDYIAEDERPATVLVIETREEIGDLLAGVLSRAGLDVIVAGTEHEAIRSAAAVDVVVLGAVPPDLSDVDVLGLFRAERTAAAPPVLVLSEDSVRRDPAQVGLERLADAVVRKPFRPAELLGTLRSLIEVHRRS